MTDFLRALFLFSGRLERTSFALIFFAWFALFLGMIFIIVEKEILNGLFILIPLMIWVKLSIIVCRLRDAGANVYFSLLLFVAGFFLVLYCLFAPSKNEEIIESFTRKAPKESAFDQSRSRKKGFWEFISDFSGRISRETYLISLFGHFAVFFSFLGLLIALEVHKKEASTIVVLLLLFQGLSLVSLTVRRAHDIGKTTRWVIFNIISVIGGLIVLIMCLVMKSDPNENEYGMPADQIEKSRSIPVESRGRFDRD